MELLRRILCMDCNSNDYFSMNSKSHITHVRPLFIVLIIRLAHIMMVWIFGTFTQ